MASLDFPISPNDQDTYEANNVIYTFNATKGLWEATSNVTVTGGGAVDLSAVNQNIIPAANLTYTIGSYESQWSTVYANLFIGDGGLLSNIVGGVASVAGATGDVSNAQLAVGISQTTISNLTVSGNVSVNYLNANGFLDINGNVLVIQDEGGNVIWGA